MILAGVRHRLSDLALGDLGSDADVALADPVGEAQEVLAHPALRGRLGLT